MAADAFVIEAFGFVFVLRHSCFVILLIASQSDRI